MVFVAIRRLPIVVFIFEVLESLHNKLSRITQPVPALGLTPNEQICGSHVKLIFFVGDRRSFFIAIA